MLFFCNFLRGNSVLVGAFGQRLCSIASLALFLAGYEVQSVDFSKENTFRDGMKSLFRHAGLGGKPIGVIIKACTKIRRDCYLSLYLHS